MATVDQIARSIVHKVTPIRQPPHRNSYPLAATGIEIYFDRVIIIIIFHLWT